MKREDLFEQELETLYQVSRLLSRSLRLNETLSELLPLLDDQSGMRRGMVTLGDAEGGGQLVTAVHSDRPLRNDSVRYGAGEGLVGEILDRGETLVVERVADEPRFLDRLGLYEPLLPFIGVAIKVNGEAVGVLAAQPDEVDGILLLERARFLEMVANLVAQSVRLSWEVEKERSDLRAERDQLRRTVRGNYGFDSIVGHTATMRRVFEQVRQVGKWDTTVLIRGESGTGKELIANAIHYNSPRANGPFLKLNCAALPDTLLESELFGHEKGAFTGAVSQRKGRFERADGGTLFLDELGEISSAFQAKLLRVLQEGEFERVGGNRTLKVNVRIIAATNRDLESAVENGDFREDLYYRLNVMPILLPPLRDRSEDIPELARFLIGKLAERQGRELENCLERAAIMSENGIIDRDAVVLTGLEDRLPLNTATASNGGSGVDLQDPSLDERERVIAALEQAGWVQAKAARLLDMTPRQIAYRIQTLNIKVRQI